MTNAAFYRKSEIMPIARKFAAKGYDVFLTKDDWSGNWRAYIEGADCEELGEVKGKAEAAALLLSLPNLGGRGSID